MIVKYSSRYQTAPLSCPHVVKPTKTAHMSSAKFKAEGERKCGADNMSEKMLWHICTHVGKHTDKKTSRLSDLPRRRSQKTNSKTV